MLLPDSRNLGLILNRLEHTRSRRGIQSFALPVSAPLSAFLDSRAGRYRAVLPARIGTYDAGAGDAAFDGTIRFMAMLALLLSPSPPPLICIEEPELGLHPDAVALLADLLLDAATRTQLIVTTHSDALISGLTEHAGSVLVCEYRGGTVIERVDSTRLEFWLNQYRLGEVWRIGELGGNP
ncbi:MAG: AAA family ATPase [Bryobacteraceae bacterium]|nr:AAA family ATPase [Bryobacteraceae bacterium]